MLDERHFKAIETKSKGGNITDMANAAGVSRNTIYKWIELEEFKTELRRCEQEFISSTIDIITSYAPKNAKMLIKLADTTTNKKLELDARLALLSKTMPNMTKLTVDDARDSNGRIESDILDAEMKEIDDIDSIDSSNMLE